MPPKTTHAEFIERATRKHGGKYTYAKAVYVNSHVKLTVTCPDHGDFEQAPRMHLSGQGCPKCKGVAIGDARRHTTVEFIEKAEKVHGGKYTYARAVYVNSRTKLVVTCPDHGDFKQVPASHLRGVGCAKCAGLAPSTTEEFIEQATRKHNGEYTYPRAVYVNNKTKLFITCPDHGDFKQPPTDHLGGHGCPKCGDIASSAASRSNTEEFIEKATLLHGGKYSYPRAVYINASSAFIIVTCPDHGDFKQVPASHLMGRGCPECARMRLGATQRSNTEEFIDAATKVHADKYAYARAVYVNSNTKLAITCPEHGDFGQTPTSHLNGNGCAKCAGTAVSTTEEFIEKAGKVHNGKYAYAKVVYQGAHIKLTITCSKHGDFEQIPANHLNLGAGCPKCDESKGERAVALVLGAVISSSGADYAREHRITGCRHKRLLPFDFALTRSGSLVGLIEYHGKQHYEPVPFRRMSAESAARAFAGTQRRDAIKVRYAVDNGIPLLIIPYWDFGNIEALVTGFVQQL